MCGIAGVFSLSMDPSRMAGITRGMADSLRHRGPDDEGFFNSEGISLGMRRLSIIGVDNGKQPLFNEDGSVAAVFNGEIFNYLELIPPLRARGHRFRTRSDGEVLVHLFEEDGLRLLDRINGMYAFCLWDTRSRTGYLVRDRIGVKPIYYRIDGGDLIFAS